MFFVVLVVLDSNTGLSNASFTNATQCRKCRHQSNLIAGTTMKAIKLPFTTWIIAFYLVGQANTGIFSLALMRHLGVNYRTA